MVQDWTRQCLVDIVEFICLLGYLLYTYVDCLIFRYILPVPLKDLSGEIVVVTGSGRGIGRELSLRLAETGATVVLWSKSSKPNTAVEQEIRSKGGRAHSYTVDVSNREQVEKTAALVRKEVGEVTMVVNNAGMMIIKPFLETTAEDIQSQFQVNVYSNFWVLREFLPGMIKRRKGHITCVSSASGILPTRHITTYSATKYALNGFMESLRDEIRHHPDKPDIKLTTAFPFYCDTEMLENASPNSRFPFFIPIVRPGDLASKIIQGIRQESEYVYTPMLIGWLAMFSWLVPPKSLAAFCDFVKCNIDPYKREKKN